MSDTESIDSYCSWATNITTCESFQNILSSDWENQKLQQSVVEIIKALSGTIQEMGLTENESCFYTSLLSWMEFTEFDVDTMEGCGLLLKQLASKVSIGLLRKTSKSLSKILTTLFSDKYNKNEEILKYSLHIMGRYLSILPDSDWNLDVTLHQYRILFVYTNDCRTVINKKARNVVLSIFKQKSDKGIMMKKNSEKLHPLMRESVKLLKANLSDSNLEINKKRGGSNIKLKQQSQDSEKLSLTLITLSKIILSEYLGNKTTVDFLNVLISCVYNVQTVEIQCQILSLFTAIFRNCSQILEPDNLAQCLTFLFDYIKFLSAGSATNNNMATTAAPPSKILNHWLDSVVVGFESLLFHQNQTFSDDKNNEESQEYQTRHVALCHLTQLVKICVNWIIYCDFDTEGEFVRKSAFEVVKKVLGGNYMTQENKEDYLIKGEGEKWLISWLDILKDGFKVDNKMIWCYIFTLINQMILRVGNLNSLSDSPSQFRIFQQKILVFLPYAAEYRDKLDDEEDDQATVINIIDKFVNKKKIKTNVNETEKKFRSILESFIGNCIKYFGIDSVLQMIPLTDLMTDDFDTISLRTWIVPLMKQFVESTKLVHFCQFIMPFIQFLTTKIDDIENAANSNDSTVPRSVQTALELLRYQSWDCLTSFSRKCPSGSLSEVVQIRDVNGKNFYDLMLSKLSAPSSKIEKVILISLRNLIKTSENADEVKSLFTSEQFHPSLLMKCFQFYTTSPADGQSFEYEIKLLLDTYLKLFDLDAFNNVCDRIMNNKLAGIDVINPEMKDIKNIELLIILAPHLEMKQIEIVCEFLFQYLDKANQAEEPEEVSHQIQKRVYRFIEQVTASNTDSTLQFTKKNLSVLLTKICGWSNVHFGSWKCRMKSLYNLFKLLDNYHQYQEFMNQFLSEIIVCVNDKNRKTRSVAGLMIVEGIINCCELSDNNDENHLTLTEQLDKMLTGLIGNLQSKMDDSTKNGIHYKKALSKALVLILSERRLCLSVTRGQIDRLMCFIVDIMKTYDARACNDGDIDRTMAYCGLDILNRLLKNKTGNFDNIYITDIGNCFMAASENLRKKIRTPIKRIIRKMLHLWDYESVKNVLPEGLKLVARNVHKALNRKERRDEESDDEGDKKSDATSWAAGSDMGSNMTMKNPHIKNIADLLEDSDDEHDEDLKTVLSGKSSIKSSKSNKSGTLRNERKKKIKEANEKLGIHEDEDNFVDLQDPMSMMKGLQISSRKRKITEENEDAERVNHRTKFLEEKGIRFLGNTKPSGASNGHRDNNSDSDSEMQMETNDNASVKSKKARFETPKKKFVKIGSKYSGKKGVMGDMKKKNQHDPYEMVKSKDISHEALKKYNQKLKQNRKHTVAVSKMSRQNKKGRK